MVGTINFSTLKLLSSQALKLFGMLYLLCGNKTSSTLAVSQACLQCHVQVGVANRYQIVAYMYMILQVTVSQGQSQRLFE